VDIDRLEDLHFAEYLLGNRALDIDPPQRSGPPSLPLSPSVRLVVLDFDGTMTDDRVWVDQDGRESVACSRSDGLGLEMLIKAGLALFVLSREKTPVVRARCEKLGIPFQQGVADKLAALQQILAERNVEPRDVVYVGNDLNDLGCMRFVGFSCAPADAHRDVKQQASHVLARPGGRGAVRELCDTLLACWTARKGQDEQER
jgi:N-acylneuraminate cytidylyltransferase